ncbi:MAG TPA: C4-type zinc ribbon domain-containing protein [Tepidisphaeraceae bacterium]|nr:C4-type zinc ribbon domain-containing protein [Tepidisphaeraceae bacterium]
MGPTNFALVKLFRADQELRAAQDRLDAAMKNVRIQERRTADLAERLKLAQASLREQQAHGARLDLEIKAKDQQIEKLRGQQQQTKNNREYQAFLVEINTVKADRGKVEDEAITVMEKVETGQAETTSLAGQLETESAKLQQMKNEIGETVTRLQAEVDSLRPQRDEAAEAVPASAREEFERLADHHEGEAMSALAKPDRRREEYLCTACNMELVTDVYNKLHSRDELVFCPSCRRILFIPEDLPPEAAINSRGKTAAKDAREARAAAAAKGEPRARGKIGEILSAAQGESVKGAIDADQSPVECDVIVAGKLAGVYKGKSVEHLERVIKFRLGEAQLDQAITVRPKGDAPPLAPGSAGATASESPESSTAESIESVESAAQQSH